MNAQNNFLILIHEVPLRDVGVWCAMSAARITGPITCGACSTVKGIVLSVH